MKLCISNNFPWIYKSWSTQFHNSFSICLVDDCHMLLDSVLYAMFTDTLKYTTPLIYGNDLQLKLFEQ